MAATSTYTTPRQPRKSIDREWPVGDVVETVLQFVEWNVDAAVEVFGGELGGGAHVEHDRTAVCQFCEF
jgi:hypothetical protein